MKNQILVGLIAAILITSMAALADKPSKFDDNGNVIESVNDNGFDEYGYNYNARIFSGAADGVDRVLDGKVWGDPTYADDHLVMKWSQAWDDARFHGANWTTDAWVNNEWNGMADGSESVWHYKIVWVGTPCNNTNSNWVDGGEPGGYCVWGEFEVLMDQGMDALGHAWFARATPNGYGS